VKLGDLATKSISTIP